MRHVVHLIDNLNLGGGAQRFLSLLLSAHRTSPTDKHTVIALYSPDREYRSFIKYHSDSLRMSSSKLNPVIPIKLKNAIQALRPDLMHLHLEVSTCMAPLIKLVVPKTKIVTSIYMVKSAAPFWVYPSFLMIEGFIDLYLCCTDELTDMGIPEKKVLKQLKIPIDVNHVRKMPSNTNIIFTRHGLSHQDIVLLSVGRLHPDKQHQLVIQAMPELIEKFKSIRLIILGDGPERKRLNQLILNLKLENHVILAGFQEDVDSYYAATTVYLRASRNEGTNLSVLKAMAYELPIVANTNNSPCECIRDRINGRRVDFKFKENILEAVGELILNKSLAKKYGSEAGLNVAEYSLDKYVEKLSQIYTNVIG